MFAAARASFALLALTAPTVDAQTAAEAGQLHARAACYRALARWTAGESTEAGAFHIRPSVAELLTNPGEDLLRWTEIGAGVAGRSGTLRAGETLRSEDGFRYPGPVEEERGPHPLASLVVRERAGPVGVLADVGLEDRFHVATGEVVLRLGGLVLSAGRESPWPGHDCSGGLLLSGRGEVDGVGLGTPWWHVPLLGTWSLSTLFGTLHEASTGNRRPFFTVLRAVWAPGADVRVGLTRGLLFGGRATSVPITFRTVGLMLLGVTDVPAKDSDFENQVASLDLSWRVTLAGASTRLHLEYGVDDSGWAFLRVPALTVGAELVASGGATVRSMGAQVSWIAPRTGSYPAWYRHGALSWGWTDRGVLLGHDLAGEGWALRLDGFRGSPAGELAGRFLLSRRGEDNLLAPTAMGWGIEAHLEGSRALRTGHPTSLRAGWRLDAGALSHGRYLAGGVAAVVRF